MKQQLLRNTINILASYLTGLLASIIILKILTSSYTPQSVGQATSIISLTAFTIIIAVQGYMIAIPLTIKNNPHVTIPTYTKTYITLTTVKTLTASIITQTLLILFIPAFNFLTNPAIFTLTLIGTLAITAGQTNDTISSTTNNPQLILARQTVSQAIIILTLIPAVTIFTTDAPLALTIARTTGALIALAYPAWHNMRKPQPDSNNIKTVWKLTKPNLHHHHASKIASSLPTFLIPIITISILGSTQTAIFATTWSIYTFLYFTTISISQAMITTQHSQLKQLTIQAFKTAAIILTIPIVFLTLTPQTILSLYGQTYTQGATLLTTLALSAIPLTITEILTANLRIQNKLKTVTTIQTVTSITLIALIILSLENYGIESIGYIQLTLFTIQTITLTFIAFKAKPNTAS